MRRFLVALASLALLLALLSASGTAGIRAPAPARAAVSPIQHIVIVVKENHTFDNYFGAYPGANGTTTGKVKIAGKVVTIPLNPFQNVPPDYGHGWGQAQTAYDAGAMDRFNQGPCQTSPYPCYQEAQRADLPNYWAYADSFVLGDNTWSSLRGPSFPNHMYTIAGASGPDAAHSAIANPVGGGSKWGCDSASGATVKLLNGTTQFPCFTGVTTLPDEMSSAGLSWNYYAPQSGAGYIWNTLDAFAQDDPSTALWKAHDKPTSQFLTDVASGNLPAVSWVIAPGPQSEHPGTSGNVYSMCTGENWTVQQINAVMASPAWASTAIFVTWDDWGGFYDHAGPQNIDGLGYGFRVPLLVISPYADHATQHVFHGQVELSSTLKFIEETFGLPSLGRRDATSGNLDAAFNFGQTPLPPLTLAPRTCPAGAVITNPNATFDD